MRKIKMTPFVKWAGGKRQLLEEIKKRLPKNYNTYYEPFVGGGAVLFEIAPNQAVINDINRYLILCYEVIKNNVVDLIKILDEIDGQVFDKEQYYEFRKKFNNKIENNIWDIEAAALFIALNKRCFNGLFRVNSKGLFNVPFNGKNKTVSYNHENLENISKYLENIMILHGDFEAALNTAKKGDFIFFDSPYAPLNSTSFEEYTKEGFSLQQHQRLSEVFKELDKKGCYIMLTNHNTELVKTLYKDFFQDVIKVKRMINSDASKRTGEEIIITNYDWRKNEEKF